MPDLTVASFLDRVSRDWLSPVEDRDVSDLLAADINDTTTSVTYTGDIIPAELLDMTGPGTVIEIDRELMMVRSVNESTKTLTVLRGYLGTTAASHVTDTPIIISPRYSRQSLLDAFDSAIDHLYPRLLRVDSCQLTYSPPFTAAPEDARDAVSFSFVRSDVLHHAPCKIVDYPGSNTGKALVVRDVVDGQDGWLTYRGKFGSPEDEKDLLQEDLGLSPQHHEPLAAWMVAYLISQHDVDRLTAETITDRLESASAEVGTASDLRQALISYHEYLVTQLSRSFPPLTVVDGFTVPDALG